MNKEDLLYLSSQLPKEAKKKLASDFGVNISYIRQILTGSKPREDIVIAAVNLLNEHKLNLEKAKNSLRLLQTSQEEIL